MLEACIMLLPTIWQARPYFPTQLFKSVILERVSRALSAILRFLEVS